MKKVTKIAPDTAAFSEQQKLRVAAYCRVSTDSDEQLGSLETQMNHYKSYIKANPAWEYAGIYYEIIVPYMIQLRFRDFVKECKNLLIYRLSDTEGCAEVLFFCLLFSTDYFERVQGVCNTSLLHTNITKSFVP